MLYRLENTIEKITGPVICIIDGIETEYPSGKSLYERAYEKYYLVDCISARDDKVIVSLIEKDQKQNVRMNWIGEEAI